MNPTTVRPSVKPSAMPAIGAAGVVVTVALGLCATALGVRLGDPAPPFLVYWDPRISLVAIPAIAVLAAALVAARRLATARISTAEFLVASFATGLAARLALGVVRDGLPGLYAVFGSAPEAQNEYLPALSAFGGGTHTFLDRFAEVATSLPVHPSGHPPGLLLLLHALSVGDAQAMAALTILVGAAAVPLTYALARAFLDPGRARIATVLFALGSSALLYGATSADALYATLGVAAAACLVRRGAWQVAGAVLLAIASLFSFALLGIGAWAALVEGMRRGWRAGAITAVVAGTALLVFYAGLYAAYGFDPIGTLGAAGEAYRIGIAAARPYAYWLFGSPAAFLVAAGLPISWYALRAAAERRPQAVALIAVIAASAVLGFTKAETERIWLFYVPLACVSAAAIMPQRRVGAVLSALVLQALLTEVLLNTIW